MRSADFCTSCEAACHRYEQSRSAVRSRMCILRQHIFRLLADYTLADSTLLTTQVTLLFPCCWWVACSCCQGDRGEALAAQEATTPSTLARAKPSSRWSPTLASPLLTLLELTKPSRTSWRSVVLPCLQSRKFNTLNENAPIIYIAMPAFGAEIYDTQGSMASITYIAMPAAVTMKFHLSGLMRSQPGGRSEHCVGCSTCF